MAGILAVSLALASASASAETHLSVAYAPIANLERLDVAALGRARRSIDLAAYILTDVAVIDALAAAGARGVQVRVVRDGSGREASGAVAEAMMRLDVAPNVSIKTKPAGPLMHLKSYLVDSATLRGGAANFSASGLKHQDNDRWETDDPAAVAAFRAAFEGLWAR